MKDGRSIFLFGTVVALILAVCFMVGSNVVPVTIEEGYLTNGGKGNPIRTEGVEFDPSIDSEGVIERGELLNVGNEKERNQDGQKESRGLSGWVYMDGVPVSDVQVHHAGAVGTPNMEGFFELRTFDFWGLVRFEKTGVPDLLTFAAKKQDSYKMAHSSTLDIVVAGDQARVAGLSVSLFWARGSGGAFSIIDEESVLWRGNLGADGSARATNVPTTLPGSQSQEGLLWVKLVLQGGATVFLQPKVQWAHSNRGGWDCRMSIFFRDPGPTLASFLLLQSESTGLPISRNVAYRTKGGFRSLWQEGRTDGDGLLFLDEKIEPGGRGIAWIKPNLTYWIVGSDLAETQGGQVCQVPKIMPQSLFFDGKLPDGVRIEATSVVWDDGASKRTVAGLVAGPGASQFHGWSSVDLMEEIVIEGGWIGKNRGVAVRALPGEGLVSLAANEEGKLEELCLPPLAVVRAKVTIPDIDLSLGAKISLWGADDQLMPYYFPVQSNGVCTFVVPAEQYPAWLILPGEKGLPLGDLDFKEGENSIVLSKIRKKLFSLQFKFAGKPLVGGTVDLNSHLEEIDGTGKCKVWGIPGSSFTYGLIARGGGGGEEGIRTDLFLGYKGEAMFPEDGASLALEIESGKLQLLGHPHEDRVVSIYSVDDSDLRSLGVKLPIPAGNSYRFNLPTGRYIIETASSSDEQEFVISQSHERLFDVP